MSSQVKSPLKHQHSDEERNNFIINDTAFKTTSSLKSKSHLLRILVVVVLLLVVLLTILGALYISMQKKKEPVLVPNVSKGHSKQDLKDEVCNTKECVQIASKIIDVMDSEVDPCKDFYEYACGGWLKSVPVPDSRTRYSRFDELAEQNSEVLKQILNQLISKETKSVTPILDKAAVFYKSCTNTKLIEQIGDLPMKKLVKDMGSWPVTDESFDESKWDSLEALTTVHKNISIAPVLQVYVAADIKNSSQNIIVFDQSGISLAKESYLKNSTFHIGHREAYLKYMKSIAKQMGANETGLKYMNDVMEFETQLANITMSVLDRRNYHSIYESMTLEEFSNRTEIPLSWLLRFVNNIFKENNLLVLPSERIVSFSTQFIGKAYKLFNELPKKTQSSYIIWQAVNVMAPLVLGKYQEIFDEYQLEAYSLTDRPPRWEVCISSTLRYFGYALGRPFVEKVYDKTAKTMSTEIIQAIKQVFIDNLETMDWMDAKTKAYAKKKAERIIENIGYPSFILNNTALELEYHGLSIKEDEHFNNYMECRKYDNLKNYFKRGKPVDKSEWSILPTTVNAYYAPTENKIGFPAGILQWPYYDKRAPRAVSYGAIGMVVGHEISHGFDDQGKDFTVEGNFDTWWTKESTDAFKSRSQCFSEQYSKFEMFDRHMNGKQTLGEDLADNGGLRQSLQAYQLWKEQHNEEQKLPGLNLTSEQLYFLAFAQVWCTNYRESSAINQIESGVHSLSRFRVIGTLQNNQEFSKAYKCPEGSIMNPKKKCRVW
ncbi:endothelin-converting enzyme 1-like [Hydra vulgaris]|uniref:Endothelin converting enzyme n=1 Tax=Hydra vulgaris TaxID=6087 RepID=Q9U9P2_HYDVU|nr:endothelin-converting enzyme 1-like [Hydra vulgaris]AAD46624.1 endothelin converting enzyme [Hydra vulgaris]